MPRFFGRLAEGVFDIEDLKFRTHELAEFVEKASKVYGFDLRYVISVGYSNGANIASSLLLLRPEIISSAVLFRAMTIKFQTSKQSIFLWPQGNTIL
jgi:phospholipase/carboxylesterase